ncbi:hypothetical protein AoKodu_06940 [Actinomyces oris K20]|nr:hypothetical protein AoKodu_06940 [Actinomyces oris K20]
MAGAQEPLADPGPDRLAAAGLPHALSPSKHPCRTNGRHAHTQGAGRITPAGSLRRNVLLSLSGQRAAMSQTPSRPE